MKIFAFFLLASTAAAQTYTAADYAYGTAPNVPALSLNSGNTSAGAARATLAYGVIALPNGTKFAPMATNAPIIIGAGANAETVTPSSISCPTPAAYGTCSFVATFTKIHGQGEPVRSATFGLQEAFNAAGSGGGAVVITASWLALGGTTGIITASTLPANVSIFDVSASDGSVKIGRGTAALVIAQNGNITVPACSGCGGGGGGTPGGTSGQIQWNNGGFFAGFTASGDATINTATGAVTLATVNGSPGACGDSTHVCQTTTNGKGLVTSQSAVAISAGGGGIANLVTGSGNPNAGAVSCTAPSTSNLSYYQDTASGNIWSCVATNVWKLQPLTIGSGSYTLSAATGTVNTGPAASRPATPADGYLYCATDTLSFTQYSSVLGWSAQLNGTGYAVMVFDPTLGARVYPSNSCTPVSSGGGGAPFQKEFLSALCQSAAGSLAMNAASTTQPPADCQIGANGIIYGIAKFLNTATYAVQGSFILPSTASTLTADIDWQTPVANASLAAVWQLQGTCIATGATVDPSQNAAVNITSNANAAASRLIRATSSASGLFAGCSPGNRYVWTLTRVPGSGSDNLGNEADLIAVRFTVQ